MTAESRPGAGRVSPSALDAARYVAGGFIVGGAEPNRRNVTSPSHRPSLAAGATGKALFWLTAFNIGLSRCAADIGLATFNGGRRGALLQRLGDVVAGIDPGDEAEAVRLLGVAGERPVTLARLLAVIDASGVPERLEALLPSGCGPTAQCAHAACRHSPHLGRRTTRTPVSGARGTCGARGGEPAPSGCRLSVQARTHTLTYRQVEYTFSLLEAVLSKDVPDGAPKELLQEILDALLEASVGEKYTTRSSSLAIPLCQQ